MIRVTVDLISAITGRTSQLGTMYIANDGTGVANRGNYTAAVCRKGDDVSPRDIHDVTGWSADALARHPKAARVGKVTNYPRRTYNVWRLVARASHACFPEEVKRAKRDERTLLDDEVMRGLRSLTSAAVEMLDAHYFVKNLGDDAQAALAWLAAADADEV